MEHAIPMESAYYSVLHFYKAKTDDVLRYALVLWVSVIWICALNGPCHALEESQTTNEINYLINLSLEELQAIPIRSASLLPDKSRASAATISTISRAQWRSRLASRIGDAIEHFPGVTILPFRFGAQAIAIRGFGGSNLPRGVSVRWDDVPLTGYSNGAAMVTTPSINLNALQKIEMVRGPASALFGSDAFHGVLSLYSLDDAPNLVEATIGSNQIYDLSSHFNLPIFDSLQTTFVAAANGQGDQHINYDFIDPINGQASTGERGNKYTAQTALIKVANKQQAPLSFHWGMYWNHFNSDRFAGPGRSQTPGISALGDQDWSDSNTDFLMTNASVIYHTNLGFTSELKGYYWQADVLQFTKVPRLGGVGENQVDVGDRRSSLSLVLRSQQPAKNQWALSIGHDELDIDQGHTKVLAPGNVLLAEVEEQFQGKSRNINSLLLEVKSNFREDTLKLVYGGRIDHYNDFGLQKTPRIGLIFTPNLNWTYKMLYGQAFRAPTAFETYGIGKFKGNPNLDPEVIDTIEFSVTTNNSDWIGGVNLFASRWQKGIIRVPSDDPNFNLEFFNVDDNRSHGLELHYELLSQAWNSTFSLSYIRSKNRTQDQEFLAFPEILLNVGLGYRISQRTKLTLNTHVQYNASSGINSDFNNSHTLRPYWRVDLAIESAITQNVNWLIGVRNLLDRDNYYPSLFNAENGEPDQPPSIRAELRYRL